MGGVSQQDTKHHFTKGGRLVANKQIVYTIVEDRGLQPVSVANDLIMRMKVVTYQTER